MIALAIFELYFRQCTYRICTQIITLDWLACWRREGKSRKTLCICLHRDISPRGCRCIINVSSLSYIESRWSWTVSSLWTCMIQSCTNTGTCTICWTCKPWGQYTSNIVLILMAFP